MIRNENHISLFFVLKEFYGKGIGRRLFGYYIGKIKENNNGIETIMKNSLYYGKKQIGIRFYKSRRNTRKKRNKIWTNGVRNKENSKWILKNREETGKMPSAIHGSGQEKLLRITGLYALRRLRAAAGFGSARSVATLLPTPPSPTFQPAANLRFALWAGWNVAYSQNVMCHLSPYGAF